ncbi:hypothetical protein ACQJBY_047813 [Aegilops geniculata]
MAASLAAAEQSTPPSSAEEIKMGVMSPTKLRMKLLGMGSHPHPHPHGAANKDEPASKSSSRLHADDHPKNSLLPQELDEGSSEYPKDRSDSSSRSRSSGSHGRSAAHSGSFEFHMEERAAVAGLGPFFRQVPSKWNDAEKWIAGRHVVHSNPIFSKKAASAHGHNGVGGGCVRVAPESAPPPSDAKKASGGSALTELPRSPSPSSSSLSSVTGPASKQRRDTKLRTQVGTPPPAVAQSSSVSMRDVGTEMTPIASQEQSRSGTPAGAATPSLSPLCSVPASPSASERELQIRTRREIAALGLQLGKMSIASWASKEDRIRTSPEKSAGEEDEAKKEEFEARAAAWAESKKCKLASRYQRKEVKIQEWENCQKSKFEAKMRHAEVQADQMKARAKNSLTKRLSTLSHKVEGKQARVEARRNRRAVRLARQVERIRKTGRVPSRFRCCSWFLC